MYIKYMRVMYDLCNRVFHFLSLRARQVSIYEFKRSTDIEQLETESKHKNVVQINK